MISIIIPTINEAERIESTLNQILDGDDKEYIREIIIADGGSIDLTVDIARNLFAKTVIVQGKNRAVQLNAGAAIANSEILFFLHADSVPLPGFTKKIIECIRNNFYSGCFRLLFDYNHWFLQGNAWFSRFDVNAVRFGDQGLFVTKEVFEKCGGYNEELIIMEDQEIIHRLKKFSTFRVVDGYIKTSARKYLKNGIYKTQGTFFLIWLLYYSGLSQKLLLKLYRKLSG